MNLRSLFDRHRAADELESELRFHVEQQTRENLARGMAPEEARRAALRTFGNPALLRDQARAAWSWGWLETWVRDLRIAGRTLLRAPGFSLVAIGVMGLGIGANVALFTTVRGMLLRPLPFRDPNRLISVYENTNDQFQFNSVSGGVFTDWQKQNRTLAEMALLSEDDFNLTSDNGGLPEKVMGASATWNLFPLLGVEPALGRGFTADDDQRSANGTVLLTWGLWKRRFGGDKAVLHQTVHLNGQPYTVIGVLPAWFYYSDPQIQLWTPIYHDKPAKLMQELGAHNFGVVARLKPGITEQQARADLSLIVKRLHDQHLDNPFVSRAANTRTLLESMVGVVKKPLYVLLAATGCVLLIACLNVGNLLVARAAARQKDIAIRSALGGGTLRLVRERLIESLLLSTAGGAAGLALASGAVAWLAHARHEMSRIEAIRIDGVVGAATVGLVVFCALVSGGLSTLGAYRRPLLTSLQDASRGSSAGHGHARMRAALLGIEVGLTVVLLIGAGLLLRSYQRLRSSDMGCNTENILTMRLDLFGRKYNDQAKLANFYRTLLERVRALPGVDGAGFTRAVPGQGYWGDNSFTIVEHPPLPQGVMQYAINRESDPGFFQAMGIPILRGHSFNSAYGPGDPGQVVINASFAQQYFPQEDPLGKHIRYDGRNWEICGVVGDTRFAQAEPPRPIQYYSVYQEDLNNGSLVIRARNDVEQYAIPVQRVLASLDPELPVSNVMTMDQLLGKSAANESFNATLLTGFAALSLLLAAAGLFGVLSYIVAQRTTEIGIRIALGAPRGQVMSRVLLDGLRPAILGLAVGLAASAGLVRLMASMLYHTEPLDPVVFAGVGAMLLAVAVGACLTPAWRASRLDPMQALRTE
ncbi:ABC transporter permease [Acidobacteria bacterium AB60]|nr:ABC transporter permease [Acidobacteria bacterium AB60]